MSQIRRRTRRDAHGSEPDVDKAPCCDIQNDRVDSNGQLAESNNCFKQNDDKTPLLRRSSTSWSSSVTLSRRNSDSSLSLSSLVDDDDGQSENQKGQSTLSTSVKLPLSTVRPWSILWDNILHTIHLQLQGMTDDFTKSGLPWSGEQCQSLLAGGTGILYCLPAIAIAWAAATSSCASVQTGDELASFAPSFRRHILHLEQAAWILQAYLSVMADYVHIHHDSFFHGLDRYYASFNTVATLLRASFYLPTMTMLALGSPPIACFVLANRAKSMASLNDGDYGHYLQQWHWCHGGWHVTGSVAVAMAVYWMHVDSANAC